jgi:hypothetical protein
MHNSCAGGSDPGVVFAWKAALNLTNAFAELSEFELIGMSISTFAIGKLTLK